MIFHRLFWSHHRSKQINYSQLPHNVILGSKVEITKTKDINELSGKELNNDIQEHPMTLTYVFSVSAKFKPTFCFRGFTKKH